MVFRIIKNSSVDFFNRLGGFLRLLLHFSKLYIVYLYVVSFSNSLAYFLRNLLLKSNLARWYLSNVGSGNGTTRLPMRPSRERSCHHLPCTDLLCGAFTSALFSPVHLAFCLNHQAALFFGNMWHRWGKLMPTRQSLCCWISASSSRKSTSILTGAQRYSTIAADTPFFCVPVY
jgi:hypothetical protein